MHDSARYSHVRTRSFHKADFSGVDISSSIRFHIALKIPQRNIFMHFYTYPCECECASLSERERERVRVCVCLCVCVCSFMCVFVCLS